MRIDDIKVGDMIEVVPTSVYKKSYNALVVEKGYFGTFHRLRVAPLTANRKVDYRRKEQFIGPEEVVRNLGPLE